MQSAVLEGHQQTILTTNGAADELKCAAAVVVALTYSARGRTHTAAVGHIAQSPLKQPPPSLDIDQRPVMSNVMSNVSGCLAC